MFDVAVEQYNLVLDFGCKVKCMVCLDELAGSVGGPPPVQIGRWGSVMNRELHAVKTHDSTCNGE